MSNKQGYIKDYNGNKMLPETTSTLVLDVAKEQALSQTLVNTPDKSVLGFPAFSTVTAYTVGDVVYYDNKLWKFTTAHAADQWDENDVTEYTVADLVNDLKAGLVDGNIVAKARREPGELGGRGYEPRLCADRLCGDHRRRHQHRQARCLPT